jgi:hypothetical protein
MAFFKWIAAIYLISVVTISEVSSWKKTAVVAAS